MSVDATRWAWQQRGVSATQKLILLALADRAGADQCAYPSHESIAADTGADIKTVKTALRALIDLGLIEDTGERVGRTKQISVWRLLGVEDRHESYPKTEGFQKRKGSVFPVKGTQKRATEPKRELPEDLVRTPLPPKDRQEAFERFYLAYPNKKSRKNAERAWDKLKPTPALVAEIMDGLRRAIDSVEWAKGGGEYIPHPATFLNGENWKDEFKAKPPGATNQTPGASSSTARSMRGHYGQARDSDNSAVAKTRRACERWAAEQASLFGADESGSIFEGEFDTIPLHPSMATHG